MLIGILLCGHAQDNVKDMAGDYDTMFQAFLADQGFTFKTWNVVDMEFPTKLSDADGWLVTGSRHGAYEDHPFIAPLTKLIQAIYAEGSPMVGVCFGHQIIAQALGGHVEKFEGGWVLGHQEYDVPGQGQISLQAWHQDQVITKPADAEVLATNAGCRNAGLIYGKRVMTLQPHPEFRGPVINQMVTNYRGTVDYPDDGMTYARDNAETHNTTPAIAQAFGDFFRGQYQGFV